MYIYVVSFLFFSYIYTYMHVKRPNRFIAATTGL